MGRRSCTLPRDLTLGWKVSRRVIQDSEWTLQRVDGEADALDHDIGHGHDHAASSRRGAICHGADGQGTKVDTRYAFPPLWGPHSFNAGAGMTQIKNAAGFIKANMPLGQGNTLSDQQAWDVAKHMTNQPRPADPRLGKS